MDFSSWNVELDRAVIATAVHAGHDLRPEIAGRMVLDEAERLREEDPHTDVLASFVGSHVGVNRSRFEVDLNRDRDTAVYLEPGESWGIEVWERPLEPDVVDRSRSLHDDFYARLGETLDELVRRHGGFVLYDVHSYNHRRPGPDEPPEDARDNPVVNLGTGSLPEKWEPVAVAFEDALGRATLGDETIDVRRNVKFQGREVARFVHDRYGDVGCALAIEFKKVFMDEWSGTLDRSRLDELGRALQDSVEPVQKAWESTWR
jgi:N-formylglutamate amidohydrolase